MKPVHGQGWFSEMVIDTFSWVHFVAKSKGVLQHPLKKACGRTQGFHGASERRFASQWDLTGTETKG